MARLIYQAITTRFIGPTNRRPARIRATAAAGSVTITWDHAKKDDNNHIEAAWTLARKYEWAGEWRGGILKDGRYVFVQNSQDETPLFLTFGPDQK